MTRERIVRLKIQFYLAKIFKIQIAFQRDAKFTLIEQITKTFTATKTENTIHRWFESRTLRHLEVHSISSSVQSLLYIPFSLTVET